MYTFMYILQIDNKFITVTKPMSVLEACLLLKKQIPSFCYHPDLLLEGNCRMCLVEIDKVAKPQASCCLPIQHNMKIFTNTPFVKKARENVIEFLLLHHPLDCPICDQGGECDLQDQALSFGSLSSRYKLSKRNISNKYYNQYIKTIMNRCIYCTRCIRYTNEFLGKSVLGSLNRGIHTEIGAFKLKNLNFDFSGNLIDICPVGALTSKTYTFVARPWEIKSKNSIDFTDGIGVGIRVDLVKNKIIRILPRKTVYQEWSINDNIRFFKPSIDIKKKNKFVKVYNKNAQRNKVSFLESMSFFTFLIQNFNQKINFKFLTIFDKRSIFLFKMFQSFYLIKNSSNNFKLYSFSHMFLFPRLVDLGKYKTFFFLGISPRIDGSYLYLSLIKHQQQRKISIFSFGSDDKDEKNQLTSKSIGISIQKFVTLLQGRSLISFLLFNSSSLLMVLTSKIYKRHDAFSFYQVVQKLIGTMNCYKKNKINSVQMLQTTVNQTGCLTYGLAFKEQAKKDLFFLQLEIGKNHTICAIKAPVKNAVKLKKKKKISLLTLPISHFFGVSGLYQNTMGHWNKTAVCLKEKGDCTPASLAFHKLFKLLKIEKTKLINYSKKYKLISMSPRNKKHSIFESLDKGGYFNYFFLYNKTLL